MTQQSKEFVELYAITMDRQQKRHDITWTKLRNSKKSMTGLRDNSQKSSMYHRQQFDVHVLTSLSLFVLVLKWVALIKIRI